MRGGGCGLKGLEPFEKVGEHNPPYVEGEPKDPKPEPHPGGNDCETPGCAGDQQRELAGGPGRPPALPSDPLAGCQGSIPHRLGQELPPKCDVLWS